MASNRNNIGHNYSQQINNNNNQNIYFANNNLNQYNLRNNYIDVDYSNINQRKMSNINNQGIINKKNNNNNLNAGDERLILCLNYLGLKKYIINFQKNGINFDEFLSLSSKDFSILNIPNKIQTIIQNFIISYINFGSLYSKEEIIQFFRMKKKGILKNNLNYRGNSREQKRNIIPKNQSANNNNNNRIKNMRNLIPKRKSMNNNENNYVPRKNSNNQIYNNRPKTHANKPIKYDSFNNEYLPHNYHPMNSQKINNLNNSNNNSNSNINNFNYNNYLNSNKKQVKNNNNMNKNNNNNMNMIKKNIFNNNNSNIINISLSSGINNANNIPPSPSVDNFSHMAVNGNYSNNDNIMKQFREMNNNNYNNLRQNLTNSNKNIKINTNNELHYNKKRKTNSNININSNINMNDKRYLNKSASNNIIQQMDNIIKRIQLTKEKNGNIMTQSNLNNNVKDNSAFSVYTNNKGYHSDGFLNEQKKIMQFNNIMNCSKNNIKSNSSIKSYNNSNTNNSKYLSGYEVNTFYTGDTSQFDSMRGDNIVNTDIKKIKGKNGRVYYSKENKAKKINEEQKKK